MPSGAHVITVPHASPLEQELKSLFSEQHSPSYQSVKDALDMYAKTEIGFGTSYLITPHGIDKNGAKQALEELTRRTPYLVTALTVTAHHHKKTLQIDVPRNGKLESTGLEQKSGHDRLVQFPILINWLTSC